jgi:hypothetical protein
MRITKKHIGLRVLLCSTTYPNLFRVVCVIDGIFHHGHSEPIISIAKEDSPGADYRYLRDYRIIEVLS